MTLEQFLKRCEEVDRTWMDDVVYEVSSTYPTLLKMLKVAHKAIDYIEWSGGKGIQEETACNALKELNDLVKEVERIEDEKNTL